MRTTLQKPAILWLTDLHLDRATSARRQFFYEEIQGSKADKILITGDISTSRQLPLHLRELAAAASPRPVYFVLGNHDFYGSSFAKVDGCVAGICRTHDNLQQLGKGEIIRLGPGTAMVGHRGWGDGRMGWGSRSFARNPDFSAIKDFEGLSRKAAFALLGQLGQESASYLRGVLPYALTCWQHVIVATHVPPLYWRSMLFRKALRLASPTLLLKYRDGRTAFADGGVFPQEEDHNLGWPHPLRRPIPGRTQSRIASRRGPSGISKSAKTIVYFFSWHTPKQSDAVSTMNPIKAQRLLCPNS